MFDKLLVNFIFFVVFLGNYVIFCHFVVEFWGEYLFCLGYFFGYFWYMLQVDTGYSRLLQVTSSLYRIL